MEALTSLRADLALRVAKARERRQFRTAVESLRPIGHRKATDGADVDRFLELQSAVFGSNRLLPAPATSANERLPGSDRQLLAECTRATLSLETEDSHGICGR